MENDPFAQRKMNDGKEKKSAEIKKNKNENNSNFK